MASVCLPPALACALTSILILVSSGKRVDIEDSTSQHELLREDLAFGFGGARGTFETNFYRRREETWFKGLNLPSLTKESGKVKPLIWVPGLVSVNLDFRVTDDWKTKLPTVCTNYPGLTSGEVFGLWMNLSVLLKIGCWLYSMKLTYGEGPTGMWNNDNSELCVRDNPGVEVFPKKGFAAANVVGGQTFAGDMFAALQFAGYDDKSLQVMEFDWRKWSIPCYNSILFAQFQERVEQMYAEQGNRQVTIAAHSMGTVITHRFLSSMTVDWKQKYVRHFASIAGPLAGAPIVMQFFLDGPKSAMGGWTIPVGGGDESLRAMQNSWAGLLSLMPSTYGDAFNENDVFITIADKNYTIKSVIDGSFFKDAVAATDAKGLGSAKQVPGRTSQDCVCKSGCNYDAQPLLGGGFRAWCNTSRECGRTRIWSEERWDYCTVVGTTFNPDGDEALHHHVSSWVNSSHEPVITAPHVPTTCFAVKNRKTRFTWKYDARGTTGDEARDVPGDGTVPVASSTMPCKAWQRAQAAQKLPVNIIEMDLGTSKDWKSDVHRGMLTDKDWLKWFFDLLNTV